MQLILGMQCAHDGSLISAPDRIARLADLVVDPRWHYTFKLVGVSYLPMVAREPRFPGTVAQSKLRGAAIAAITSPSAARVSLTVSKKESLDDADFIVETGRHTFYVPTDSRLASAKWRMPRDAYAEVMAAKWIELQHAILEALAAKNAVLVTGTDAYFMTAEIWLGNTSVDGKPMHPDPDEISSYEVNSRQLGNEYIRAPRWGTYLKPAHVAAVGGRDKIVAVVKPPVVRDVGDRLYVQLSQRVSDATAPETLARQRAFADLVAPITMPRLPPR